MAIKDINGIKLQGAMFQQETTLEFGLDQKRICLIYGRNGTGKSTISRAVEKISGKTEIDSISACFVDKNSSPVVLNDDELKNIHVFNEDFIKDRIWLEKSPEAIVMLRDENEIEGNKTRTIADVDDDIEDCETERNGCEDELNEYNDPKNEESPLFYRNRIANTLKRPGGWASKRQQITGSSHNAHVNDSAITRIIQRDGQKYSPETIENDYYRDLQKLQSTRENKSKVSLYIPARNIIFDEDSVISLLAEKIESPQLSVRDRTLLGYVSSAGFGGLKERQSTLGKEDAYCPYCLQDIPAEHKEHLLKTISQILNDKADIHRRELEEKHLPDFSTFDVTVFEVLNRDVFVAYRSAFNELKTVIAQINDHLDAKTKNLYEPSFVESFHWKDCYKRYMEAADRLETEIKSYNQIIDDSSAIVERLCDMVDEMTWRETESDRIELAKREIEKQQTKDQIEFLDDKIDRLEAEKLELEQQLRSTDIAMEKINEYLSIVYNDDKTIRLQPEDIKTYKVISNGSPILSQSLSTGERNIIALCYFFVSAMTEKNEKDAFKEPRLFVIDDPICSFDMERRVGVLSFLRTMCGQIIETCSDSKIMILSHDLFTLQEINKILRSFKAEKTEAKENIAWTFFELRAGNLQEINKPDDMNEYAALMEAMYLFAAGLNNDYSIFAGNAARRLLEAFGVFAYDELLWQLNENSKVWDDIQDTEFREKAKRYMARSVLNEESHFENRMRRLNDFLYGEMILPDERINAVRFVFVLMYELFPSHVKSHLKTQNDWESNIKVWKEELFG